MDGSYDVFCGNCAGDHLLHHPEEDQVLLRRSGSVCYGASCLSPPFPEGHSPSCVGARVGIYEEGRHHPVPVLRGNVVPWKLWLCRRSIRPGGFRRFSAGFDRRCSCSDLRSSWIRYLAGGCILPVRLRSKGRHCFHHVPSFFSGRGDRRV